MDSQISDKTVKISLVFTHSILVVCNYIKHMI